MHTEVAVMYVVLISVTKRVRSRSMPPVVLARTAADPTPPAWSN